MIVVLTGAGISQESGIPTFRDGDGLWENHRVEDVATPEAFQKDPVLVQRFYNARRRHLLSPEVQPNPAHQALAQWERALGGDLLVVTQNIDNLHERAGSRNVVHMHGELLKMRCSASGQVYSNSDDIGADHECRCCGAAGTLRPHIVWFGEMPLNMEMIYDALETCRTFISIGTSGNVYPAAQFVSVARQTGAQCIEVNLERTNHRDFHRSIVGKASEMVPQVIAELSG